MPAGFSSLPLQGANLPSNLPKDVGQTQEICLRPLQFSLRLPLLDLETHHPRGLLKNGATILRFGGQDLVDLSLLHDRVSRTTYSRVQKQPLDVLQAAIHPV
ncbi:MAG: hypothetical protein EBT75_00280 [Proteobacteria bacterium]|nr:hypothetical protein [Pseudomonadota bacterium]